MYYNLFTEYVMREVALLLFTVFSTYRQCIRISYCGRLFQTIVYKLHTKLNSAGDIAKSLASTLDLDGSVSAKYGRVLVTLAYILHWPPAPHTSEPKRETDNAARVINIYLLCEFFLNFTSLYMTYYKSCPI